VQKAPNSSLGPVLRLREGLQLELRNFVWLKHFTVRKAEYCVVAVVGFKLMPVFKGFANCREFGSKLGQAYRGSLL
jgi:hypothetical protein